MKIGSIDLGNRPLFLAPMEDVTNAPFRLLCKEFGADMVTTEFVSSDALIRAVDKTQAKLSISDAERPVAIQIYGRDVDSMVAVRAYLRRGSARYHRFEFRLSGKESGR